jgi:hypothetical protein
MNFSAFTGSPKSNHNSAIYCQIVILSTIFLRLESLSSNLIFSKISAASPCLYWAE